MGEVAAIQYVTGPPKARSRLQFDRYARGAQDNGNLVGAPAELGFPFSGVLNVCAQPALQHLAREREGRSLIRRQACSDAVDHAACNRSPVDSIDDHECAGPGMVCEEIGRDRPRQLDMSLCNAVRVASSRFFVKFEGIEVEAAPDLQGDHSHKVRPGAEEIAARRRIGIVR